MNSADQTSALRCPRPDLQDRRGDRWLLVWGDVPAWVVVDDEARLLIQGLADGSQSPLGRDARAVLGGLAASGVLGPPTLAEDTLRIDNITVNLTRECPLSCRACYERGRERHPSPTLTVEVLRRGLSALQPAFGRAPSLSLLGGEPFLVPDLMLGAAGIGNELGMTVSVSTSGQLGDVQLFKRLATQGVRVQVSIDGATADTHDANRGSGTFQKAIWTLHELVAAGVATEMCMVVHRGNLHELPAFFDLALAAGAAQARFLPVKAIGGGRGAEVVQVPLPELMAAAVGMFSERPERARIAGSDALYVLARQCSAGTQRRSCGAGRRTLLIDADGRLHPCLNLVRNGLSWGSLWEGGDSLTAWRSAPGLRQVRECTDMSSAGHECRDCPLRSWCLGGCRGEVLAAGGDLAARSPDCPVRRTTIIDMLWLIAERPGWMKHTL